MKQKFPLVLIEWEDAYSGNHDWFKIETMPEAVQPVFVMSVGFLMRINPDRLTIAQSFSHDSAASLWTIPRKMVRKITKLRNVEIERGDEE